MKTIKLTPFQHLIKPEAIIPFQIGNLYRCTVFARCGDKYVPATWTMSHNSIYRAIYQWPGILNIENIQSRTRLCRSLTSAGSFGLWKVNKYEPINASLVYIIEPTDTP